MVDDFPYLVELWSQAGDRDCWKPREIAELLYAGNVVGDAAHPGMPADLAEYQQAVREEWKGLGARADDLEAEAFARWMIELLREVAEVPLTVDEAHETMTRLGSMVSAVLVLEYRAMAQVACAQARVEADRRKRQATMQPARAAELLDQRRELLAEAREWQAIAARPATWN